MIASPITGFRRQWDKEKKKKSPSYYKAVMKAFGPEFLWIIPLIVLAELFRVAQPVLLGRVVKYFQRNQGISNTDASLSALGVVLCSALFISMFHPLIVGAFKIGMRMRVASISLMYKKVYLY
jgi:ATP-binding cassette, subfamily C (CFTR/MRP), member 4